MSYQKREFTYASSDGKSHITAYLFTPAEGAVRAVVQLIPDLRDRVGRYTETVEALTAAGFAVCGNDHLGHGHTARHSDELGFFAPEDGADTVTTDVHKLSLLMRTQYRGAPLILMGQGMGAIIARLYMKSYYRDVEGLVLLGIGAKPFARLWRIAAARLARRMGEEYRSERLGRMVFGSYNRKLNGDPDGFEWLTRDDEAVAAYATDPLCAFCPTVSAYAELFSMMERVASGSTLKAYPKSLPTLIASGDEDPFGGYGRVPRNLAAHLTAAGASDVTLMLYPGARHELHTDTDRAKFHGDLVAWLKERF